MNRWLYRVYLTLITISLFGAGCSGNHEWSDTASDASRNASTWHKRITAINNDSWVEDGGACMVGTNPAICYHNEDTDELMYIRATDLHGLAWPGSPVVVDTTGTDIGTSSSLAMVNGRPAIAYQQDEDLFFVRAGDATGTTWGSPVQVDTSKGYLPTLLVVNGYPAIACCTNSTGLYYIQADDADGTDWTVTGQPVQIASDSATHRTNLAIINGKPAVAYIGTTGGYEGVYFEQAQDADGNGWSGTRYLLDSEGSRYPALVEASDGPVVAYERDYTDGGGPANNLWARQASNADGTSWNTRFQIDTEDNGAHPSFATVDGKPYLTYLRDDQLMLARATNTAGSAFASPEVIDASFDGYDTGFFVCNSKAAIVSFEASDDFEVAFWSAVDTEGRDDGEAETYLDREGTAPVIGIINSSLSFACVDADDIYFRRAADGYDDEDAVLNDVGTPISMVQVLYTIPWPPEVRIVPAVCWFDTSDDNLYYAHALDSAGVNWGGATQVSNPLLGGSTYGRSCSMALVNGNPAIAYLDNVSGVLWYERANDPGGDNWPVGAGVQIDANANASYGVSMEQTRGTGGTFPAIAYTADVWVAGGGIGGGSWQTKLQYECSDHVSGTTWGNGTLTLDNAGAPEPSLHFTGNNYPCVAYYVSGTGLKFVRGNDTEGNGGWDAAQTIATNCTGISQTSHKRVYGRPAVAYLGTSSELRYAQPGITDVEGQYGWSDKAIDIFSDNVGLLPSMLESATNDANIVYAVQYPNTNFYIRRILNTPYP